MGWMEARAQAQSAGGQAMTRHLAACVAVAAYALMWIVAMAQAAS